MKNKLLKIASVLTMFLANVTGYAESEPLPTTPFGTTVFYGNGVFNTRDMAQLNLDKLIDAAEDPEANGTGRNLNEAYNLEGYLAYNQTEGNQTQPGFIGNWRDIFESLQQKMNMVIPPLDFYLAMHNITDTEHGNKIYLAIRAILPEALVEASLAVGLTSHLMDYNKTQNHLRRVLLVSHSQGNLFANTSFGLTRIAYANSFANMQVSSPDSRQPVVPLGRSGHEKYDCDILTTLNIGIPATQTCPTPDPADTDVWKKSSKEVCTPNPSGGQQCFTQDVWYPGGDSMWHGFKEVYLNIPTMRTKIMNQVATMLDFQNFKYPFDVFALEFNGVVSFVAGGSVKLPTSNNPYEMKIHGLGLADPGVEVVLVNSDTKAEQVLLSASSLRTVEVGDAGRDVLTLLLPVPLPGKFHIELRHASFPTKMDTMHPTWKATVPHSQDVLMIPTSEIVAITSVLGDDVTATLNSVATELSGGVSPSGVVKVVPGEPLLVVGRSVYLPFGFPGFLGSGDWQPGYPVSPVPQWFSDRGLSVFRIYVPQPRYDRVHTLGLTSEVQGTATTDRSVVVAKQTLMIDYCDKISDAKLALSVDSSKWYLQIDNPSPRTAYMWSAAVGDGSGYVQADQTYVDTIAAGDQLLWRYQQGWFWDPSFIRAYIVKPEHDRLSYAIEQNIVPSEGPMSESLLWNLECLSTQKTPPQPEL